MFRPRALSFVLLLAPFAAGCASAEREERGDAAPVEADQPAEGGEHAPQDGEEPLAPRPYEKPVGGRREGAPPRRAVRFRAPERWPAPAKRERRPRLKLPAGLAVAWVEQDLLVRRTRSFLALEARLAKDVDLREVSASSTPPGEEVGWRQLTEQAREAGRELLLLELRPGPSGAPREGLLFATAKGELLAAVPLGVEEVGRDPPWAGDDLVARVARAYELTCAPPPR